MEAVTAKARYEALVPAREAFVRRARENAELTFPALFPREGLSAGADLPEPAQSLGARGVDHLANKMLMALFPPNVPFFRYKVDGYAAKEIEPDEEFRAAVERGLATYERELHKAIEATGDRSTRFEALRQLLVAGNVTADMTREGTKLFRLDSYVCRRDGRGNLLEWIGVEDVGWEIFKDQIEDNSSAFGRALRPFYEKAKASPNASAENENVEVYTHLRREGDMYVVTQEVEGLTVPGSHGRYPVDAPRHIVLRWSRIPGEHYGRGFIESHIGDLRSVEVLQTAITEASAAAARVLYLVRPNGAAKPRVLAETVNGGFAPGEEGDVTQLRLDKAADMRIARETLNDIKRDLSFIFLLNSTVQRDAERVTAAEIKYVANELESALGGVYSLFAVEFQLPYVRRQQRLAKQLPKLPKGIIEPTIVTGIEGLGRGAEDSKLTEYVAEMVETLGPEITFTEIIDPVKYAKQKAAYKGIVEEELLMSDDDRTARAQQRQQQQTATALGPEMVKQAGAVIQSQTGEAQ
jgi:hypothetical protein